MLFFSIAMTSNKTWISISGLSCLSIQRAQRLTTQEEMSAPQSCQCFLIAKCNYNHWKPHRPLFLMSDSSTCYLVRMISIILLQITVHFSTLRAMNEGLRTILNALVKDQGEISTGTQDCLPQQGDGKNASFEKARNRKWIDQICCITSSGGVLRRRRGDSAVRG